jgi:hypothetical protein
MHLLLTNVRKGGHCVQLDEDVSHSKHVMSHYLQIDTDSK